MSASSHLRARHGGLPGWVNMAAALLLALLVITLAFRGRTEALPAISEFAPQAQEIRSTPPEQTSQLGRVPGGPSGPGAPSPSPSPSPPVSLPNGAVISHCVGDPPRQIEDPQSPP